MKRQFQSLIKYSLVFVGRCLPSRAVIGFSQSIKYLELGKWAQTRGYKTNSRFAHRDELFDFVAKQIHSRVVLYLEFGVFEGESTRAWSKLLTNPESSLHGFDSFEGLPEDWNSDCLKGCFSTDGVIPEIDDPRVQFFKGWFDETLPRYQFPNHEVLVINIDSDLYSSAIYVLRALKDHIAPGTYIYFDEFNNMEHEYRAFSEFVKETGMRFSLFAVSDGFSQAVFRREA